jgi:hypothetical protein
MAFMLMALGGVAYPVWFFAMVLTVSGLSRVVGDQVMLDEPITFRGCFALVRRRFGDIFIMGLLSMALMFGLSMVFYVVFFVVVLAAVLLGGVTVTAGLPNWIGGTLVALIALAAIALGVFILLHIVSRFVFLPQVLMIEGVKAGDAIARAFRLGKGNWYRVGAIFAFAYFVSGSLLAAMTLPVLGFLYFIGALTAELFTSPYWNVVYTAFSQIANVLTLPIWVVAFTLLYFDSRVRKEGYDVELMARELPPGFFWAPPPPVGTFRNSVLGLGEPLAATGTPAALGGPDAS